MKIQNLIEVLSLPKDWLEKRIKNAKEIFKNLDEGWILLTEFSDPFCLILNCNKENIKEFENKLDGFLHEQVEITLAILIIENEYYQTYRRNLSNNSVEKISNSFESFKLNNKSVLYKKEIAQGQNIKDLRIIQKDSDNLESLIYQLHSTIRDIDGFHADVALDEICKLLYVKLYDEEATKEGQFYKFQRERYSTSEECSVVIRNLYKEANEYDKRVYSLRIPGYKRSRGVFDSQLTLSSEAISKIVELIQSFSFSKSDTDLKGRIFQNLISPVLRGGLGQYFTPPEVVSFIVDLMKPQINELIIDPFAGSGHFLTTSIKFIKTNNENLSQKSLDEFLFNKLHGIEISERMVRISMTDMRLHGDGHSNIRCVDALLEFSNYQDLHKESFDLVMTNPPFGSVVNSDNMNKYKYFGIAKGKKSVPLEILGLERSIDLLRTNGKIAIILPDSIFVNSNLKYVRDWIRGQLFIYGIISLPVETFSPFGANIKTTILIGRKKEHPLSLLNNHKIFVAEIENIGYDASGRVTGVPDTRDILLEFEKYLKDNNIDWV